MSLESKVARGLNLTTHLQLMRRSGQHGSMHPLIDTPLWRSAQLSTRRALRLLLNFFMQPRTLLQLKLVGIRTINLFLT
jgi:hypothetical protein